MPVRQPRYDAQEHARRGDEIYERCVRPHVEAAHPDQIVAIDIDTEAFEVAADTVTAAQRLLARFPDAQIWFVRIGHPAVYRFGPRARGNAG
jgi:hypothetical protein